MKRKNLDQGLTSVGATLSGLEELFKLKEPAAPPQHFWAEPQLFLLPFCAPQHRHEDRLRTIKIVESVTINGMRKERKFKVIPDPDFGLPGLFDFDVMLIILQVANGASDEEVELPSIRRMLELMRRPVSGAYANLLRESLKRLAATNCVSEGFFYSKPRDMYVIENFQFLTAAHIKGEDDQNGGRFEKTRVRLHPLIRANLNANFKTLVDFDFLHSLKTDIAKPLTLHLSYRFFKNQGPWTCDYKWLADRLAIKVHVNLKRAKDQMKPAFQELVNANFLESWEWLANDRIRFVAGPKFAELHAARVRNRDEWLVHEQTSRLKENQIATIAAEQYDPLASICAEYAINGWSTNVAKKAQIKGLSESELREHAVTRRHTFTTS